MTTTYTPSRAVRTLVDFAGRIARSARFDGTEQVVAHAALRAVVIDEMLQLGNFSSVAELTEMASAWCDAAIAEANAKHDAEPSEIFKASRDETRHPRTADGKFVPPPTCPDCGVAVGQPHDGGCDVARCPECGMQRIQCDEPGHDIDEDRAVWTGEWPGKAECQRFGWYAVFVPNTGWVPASPGDLNAVEDLNRLILAGATGELVWDSRQQEFVRPGQ